MGEFAAQTPPSASRLFSEYRVPFVLLVASVVCIGASVMVYGKTLAAKESIQFSGDIQEKSSSKSAEFVVDVSGAVLRPGVYLLPPGSRIADALAKAGGTTPEIDQLLFDKMINRAGFVTDSMKIYVPKKENSLSGQAGTVISKETVVSINTASQSQLEALSGIGVVTAQKIIDNRPYANIGELVSKHVISASLLDKLTNQLSL